ncbi:VOC family protein [Saccharicrinis sp. FJH54]|uniref:VOC family protein n=1 Tax=Saccharicrinis sp. FJH54 TaxID=3344665 RepID=UPI0035D481C5
MMRLRCARHTDQLDIIVKFYQQILGLDVIGSFKDHQGYDGVFLGLPGADWHLEFTTSEQKPEHIPDHDDLLVFYPDSEQEYQRIIKAIEENHIASEVPVNPYWQENGVMIKDPDGFLIVIRKFT